VFHVVLFLVKVLFMFVSIKVFFTYDLFDKYARTRILAGKVTDNYTNNSTSLR